jgi:ribosome-interacting GTPase 1
MPIPHQEMRRIVRRRIQGTEGTERIRILRGLLGEFPGYTNGPYGELRKWVQGLIDESAIRRSVKHQDEFHVPKEGCAQVVLVGPPNSGKSTLLRELTHRPVPVGNYRFTTLRPAAGALDCGGARVQLVDLPGLVEGARDGAGGGRLLLTCVRAADALVYCLPAERDGFDEGLRVADELRGANIRLPAAVLITKADLPDAERYVAEARAAFSGVPLCATSQDADRRPVVDLVWSLLGFIRVWPSPKGRRDPDPVVLPGGSNVEAFIRKLDNRWLERFRRARVTGPSAQFAGQAVGLAHVLQDGDDVDLALHA